MTILFVTEIVPFPPNGGEKLRCYGLLKLMSELNYSVHAIIGKSTINNAQSKDINGIKYYTFDFTHIKSGSRIKRYYDMLSCNKVLLELINNILQQNKVDVVYIDYSFYGQYIDVFRRKHIPVIYGTHNAQAAMLMQRPAISIKNRFLKITDYVINRLHEFYFFNKANALIVVSESDKKYHAAFVKRDKIFVIPNFLIESEYNSYSQKKENYIIMTANFNAFQNAYGLEWFVREVWDNELWNQMQLLLIGLGSIEIYNILNRKYSFSNVTAFGEVDDLKPYISKAMISIVPLLHGSGTRLKCLESMALKTQLVSTTKGAEGIDHNNSIILADTPVEFKHALLEIIIRKTDLTDNAYNVFLDKYSLMSNKMVFANIIQSIV